MDTVARRVRATAGGAVGEPRRARPVLAAALVGVVAAGCAGSDEHFATPVVTPTTILVESPTTLPEEPDPTPTVSPVQDSPLDDGLVIPDPPPEADDEAPREAEPVAEEPEEEAGFEPTYGGTLRVGVEAEVGSLSPVLPGLSSPGYVMLHPVVEPLAYWSVEREWIPYLAESFTRLEDGAAWRMKLREGIRFHDGTELDAEDVVATFEAQMTDPGISLALAMVYPPSGGVRKIDDYTVEYHPLQHFAEFPAILTGQVGMVLPSEWLADARTDQTLNQTPPGTGPFMVSERVQDEVTVLARNPDYWARDSVDIYLDSIEIYPITDPAVTAARLIAGDLDLTVTASEEAIFTMREGAITGGGGFGVVTGVEVEGALLLSQEEGVKVSEDFVSSEAMLMMNTQVPPFDDIRARQALTFATPRELYSRIIRQGTSPLADTMFHPDLKWHNPDIVQEADMPERAGPLVEAYCGDFPANCREGRISMEYQHPGPSVRDIRITELLLEGWGDHFDVEDQQLPQDQHIIQVGLGQYNAAAWRMFGETDPDLEIPYLQCSTIGPFSLNWARHCDEETDELLFEQRSSDDADRRVELWQEIQQRINDAYVYIFFEHVNWTIGARTDVHNICGQTAPDGETLLLCNQQGRLVLNQVWKS